MRIEIDRRPILVPAMVQLGHIAGDAKEPPVQRLAIAQLADVVPGPQKRFLRQILAGLAVMAHGAHKQVNPFVVTTYEILGRRPLSPAEPARQCGLILSRVGPVRADDRLFGL